MAKLFSIVICTYNGQKYLNRVIDSIEKLKKAEQLLDKVLVVDNASTDNTAKIVKERREHNLLIEYAYEGIQGLAEARKHAVDMESEWIIYFDDDNLPNENWLIEAADCIQKNPTWGVFGGRNIAKIEETIGEEENLNLQAIPGNLACHFANMDEYIRGERSRYKKAIFGAGMVIRKSILVNCLKNGWCLNLGRNGNNLGAYEDTELIIYAERLGYKTGNCDSAWLEHIIPPNRLKTEYLLRLRYEMDECYFKYMRHQKKGELTRLKSFLKAFLQIVYYKIKFNLTNNKMLKIRYRFLISGGKNNIRLYFRGI